MSGITTHVLDTSRGRPAAGVTVTLEIEVAVRILGATPGAGQSHLGFSALGFRSSAGVGLARSLDRSGCGGERHAAVGAKT